MSRKPPFGRTAGPWNVNIHYDAKLDASVPDGAVSALDVGCGDGFLAARLSRRVPQVVAVDVDRPVLERAKQRFADAPVQWQHGDVLVAAGELGRFDAVVSNAALHHFPDTRVALRCLRDLVGPGGTLAIVTFARAGWRDLPWALLTLALRGIAIRLRGKWEHSAPTVWPPCDTVHRLRHHVRAELPGAEVSRLLLGRIFIRWRAPAT
ncbi:SAM-dependent methyltransferase [Mycobacterium branderi]|uniref:SAM-dependent methyltransferase n=1 Tax=Mycobacterium branderi TaxID=43348 RepID=A0AA91RFX0_9MYCO|nr:class I SAM-dependent methyltransferase [Mycobacterium branderi]ORA32437.1 SAM-dependent methyltransferase [Mycobacterium branderi]